MTNDRMKIDMPSKVFDTCLSLEKYYHHVENGGDYYVLMAGGVLYIFLQWTHGKEDWKNNFDFPAKPYKDMPKAWRAHRGFVRVWKSIEPYIEKDVKNPEVKSIVVVGYSHGAALAVLAHEYVWFSRPDIREKCISLAFEAPRVFCGVRVPAELKERWSNLYVFRVANDIVTHVPPALFGYKHVGNFVHIMKPKAGWVAHRKLGCVNAHYPDNVLTALERCQAVIKAQDEGAGWKKYKWFDKEEEDA